MERVINKQYLLSYSKIYRYQKSSRINRWFWFIMLFLILILFMPWTQNIKSKGTVTSLYQEERPQEINSPIPGKIEKWWVKEGDFVKKGDTILQLSEIKESYLDPNLIDRTKEQLDAKKGSVEFYKSKINSYDIQLTALNQALKFKQMQLDNKKEQLNNKLLGEKAELEASKNEVNILKEQLDRQLKMHKEGLVSQTQLEQRNLSFQQAQAKKISLENKIAQTNQDILNINIEKNSSLQEYSEKISKTEGERFQCLSQIAGGQGDVSKLQNQIQNYIIRNQMYYLLAPQDGQIVQAKKMGIGELLKEGEAITTIVPTKMNYAVEMFVNPVDLPLVSAGQKVRLTFDGYPAIVFSGWPNNSYGTFAGEIFAIENTINPNGQFRVLVIPDQKTKPWPEQLLIGNGAQGITLLKDVPIWYEIWRNINGFPPDFYQHKSPKNSDKAKK